MAAAMHPMMPLRNRQGITLFELLVAVLLLGLVSTMIYSMFDVSIRFSSKGEKRLEEMAREQGLLELIGHQVNDAWHDVKMRRIRAVKKGDTFQLYTRFPLLHRDAGLVLAIYRYDEEDHALYYTEKRDFYNADYTPDFVPDLDEMRLLGRFTRPLTLAYATGSDTVTVGFGDDHYQFVPRCHLEEVAVEGLI